MSFDSDNKKVFKKEQNKFRKVIDGNIKKYRTDTLDPKRQVSKYQKEEIWNLARIHDSFDKCIFRKDALGNVAVKGISYNTSKDSPQLKFAYEFEHIVSHCNGGRTDIVNICILNAQINRSKGSKELMEMSFYEAQGRKSSHGVSFDTLLVALETNLHNTCLKYNFLFVKTTDKKWSIQTIKSGKYRKYNNEYRKNNIDAETVLVGATLAVGAAHIVGTGVCIASDKCVRFVKEKVLHEKPEPVPEVRWHDAPVIKEIVGFLTIGAAVLVGILVSENAKPRQKK